MGDSGRSRWSNGAGVVSAIYLERRFLKGALSSLVLKTENVEQIQVSRKNKKNITRNNRKIKNIYIWTAVTWRTHPSFSCTFSNNTTQLLSSDL